MEIPVAAIAPHLVAPPAPTTDTTHLSIGICTSELQSQELIGFSSNIGVACMFCFIVFLMMDNCCLKASIFIPHIILNHQLVASQTYPPHFAFFLSIILF